VDHVVVVAAPSALPAFRRFLDSTPVPAECVVQPAPTGMLPAILCALPIVAARAADHVWITWCDQIAISPDTVRRLADESTQHPGTALVLPTARQSPPYIHLARDPQGRIVRILQRREGADMPAEGESDTGLFALRRDAYLEQLVAYDRSLPASGPGTGERNFLPFIPWLAARLPVRTFAVDRAEEAVGLNTPEDLRILETYLRERR
jgi:bifunctional N-acetylglucosamine-1-phosphate-uridyltransferase/glucosamine-1-phosphate-acetyltransferase GlmU-like protein